jgi:hypothetical protein
MKTPPDDIDMSTPLAELEIAPQAESTPSKVLIYGVEGIGKTTLAAQFPNPLFIDLEGSTVKMKPQPARMADVSGYEQLLAQLRQIYNCGKKFDTLVIDSLSALEGWIEDYVVSEGHKENAKINSIEDFGYAKGHIRVEETFRAFLDSLEFLMKKHHMHVVLIAHSTVHNVTEPGMATGYDRYELNLGKRVASLAKQWPDAVLFARYKDIIVDGERGEKTHAIGGRDRVIYCNHTAALDAKNRFGLPDVVPMTIESLKPIFA